MYKEFTQSAELIRKERYQAARRSPSRRRPGLKVTIGEALVTLGNRLTDTSVAPGPAEGFTV